MVTDDQPVLNTPNLSTEECARAIDDQISHVWMVRTFLKHSEEAGEDEELASVHRDLYDFMLALGPSLDKEDWPSYLKLAKKKVRKLRNATDLFSEIQPEVSGHMNFRMSAHSLRLAVQNIEDLLQAHKPQPKPET